MKTTPTLTAAREATAAALRRLGDTIAAQWVETADTAQMLAGGLLDAGEMAGQNATKLREAPAGDDRDEQVQRTSDLERLRVAARTLSVAVRDAVDADRLAREALTWLGAGMPVV